MKGYHFFFAQFVLLAGVRTFCRFTNLPVKYTDKVDDADSFA